MQQTHHPCQLSPNKNSITIPHVIFNLSPDAQIYIPKGTIVAHPDGSEPEVDVIEVAETIKEAKETMQYRNHLPSRPRLPMPPESDMICSPAEVKYHRRGWTQFMSLRKLISKELDSPCSLSPWILSVNSTPHLDKDTGMLLLLFVCTLSTYFVYH